MNKQMENEMKLFTAMLIMTLSTNIYAASKLLDKSAKNVNFKDMKIVKVVDSKTPYNTICKKRDDRRTPCTEYRYTYKNAVKVSLGFSALKEICRSKRGQEVCRTHMIPQRTTLNLDIYNFDDDTIQILKNRKRFASSKKYAALAKKVLEIETEKTRAGTLVTITNK